MGLRGACPPRVGSLGQTTALASLGVTSRWVHSTPRLGQSPRSSGSQRGTGSGCHGGRSQHLARGQSWDQSPQHLPALACPPSSQGLCGHGDGTQSPPGHGIQTLTGMTPKALRWWHPESLGDSTQTSMGMAPRHPQEQYPRPCGGGGNQNPMEMAPKALWWQQSPMGKRPKTCDESTHSSMGTSPTALWGWHPEPHSPVGMAPRVPWGQHPRFCGGSQQPHGDGT